MDAQLSTSGALTQLIRSKGVFSALAALFLSVLVTPVFAQGSNWEKPSDVEIRIEPLSAIDRHFMANQRAEVEGLANRLGRRLTGTPDRDLDTLQTILDRNLVSSEDVLTLQAMGIVLGDLLGQKLDMDWVVYRDRAGRSRALRYRSTDVYLFPVTMISRRREAGNTKPVVIIYEQAIDATLPQLPGARWR